MAKEFIARYGIIAKNNSTISGSLIVTQGITGSFTGSLVGSLTGTASYASQALSASFTLTSSYVENAQTASYVLNAVSSSFSSTSSYLNTLNQDLTFNGNLILNGTASITYLNVAYESSSIIYSSGSNQFGDATNDVQLLIGTTKVSGSFEVTGSTNIKGSGNTSSTYSLRVKNSSDVHNLQIKDDGSVYNLGAGSISTNTAFGDGALISNTFGSANIAIGAGALTANTFGGANVAVGRNALSSNVLKSNLTAIGHQALKDSTLSEYCVAVGYNALLSSTTGVNNVAVGSSAGSTLTTGSNNTFIGHQSDALSDSIANSTAIGNGAKVATDNTMVFGNTSVTTNLFNGNVGIGLSPISGSLHVSGGVFASSFTGSLLGTASYASQALSASFATTSSYVTLAQTASFVTLAQTASFVTLAQTASFVTLAQTASFVTTAQTASFVTLAQTASFVTTAQTASFINSTNTNAFVQNGNSFGTTAILGTNDNQSLQFETNGSTKMSISSSGDVGIGTTPSTKLDVRQTLTGAIVTIGDISVGKTSANVMFGEVDFYNSDGSGNGAGVRASIIASTGIASGAGGNLRFNINDGVSASVSEAMRIDALGNVGIGVTSPTAVLHLKAGTATANTAPLKFNSGPLLSIAEAGAVEFLTDAYYGTITTGAARKTFAFVEDNNIYSATVSLNTTQIKALNTTPVLIVAAPGAGKYIEVISATSELTFVTAAYTTNTSLILINTGATNYQMIVSSLSATVSSTYKFVGSNFTPTTATQIIANAALNVSVLTGNPATGAGTVKIKVLYRIVTI